ncbi:hypothetical protein HPP92_021687 [Vanilla planifolia]|uniref:GH18 domain-containing protein n=1 Tax=Vanilla planifolia TaxID=51239 RepID=A0A835UHN1_VANPL|nr:hypothetical protein HPP92_022005 [Vanilla planifolia]KAG0463211.1 hypothetical protein HPP92_021687 [Vanilla planifolia]
MEGTKLLCSLLIIQILLPPFSSARNLFREYIGAEFNGVRFSDVPINPGVEFHFILAFAIDYTSDGRSPTDGKFSVFWDADNLTPSNVAAFKQSHSNVKVALSLGGDTVGNGPAYFDPSASSIDTWVNNAAESLTGIIRQYGFDGIDVDYEHFRADPDTFAECVGRLLTRLKDNGVISFASIAPYDDDEVQSHYLALWRKYGEAIDYVNFQFYAYDAGTTVAQFLEYYEKQCSNYDGGKVMVSFSSEAGGGGLSPGKGFFGACRTLRMQGRLNGIFVWSADDSMNDGFRYEGTAQNLLANAC